MKPIIPGTRHVVAALMGVGLLFGSSAVMAQGTTSGVYSSGGAAWGNYPTGGPWTGYAPSGTWTGYAPPRVVVAPQPVAPAAPVYVAPGGYATAPAWTGYNPGTAWSGYVQAQPGQVTATAPARRSGFRGTAAVVDGPSGPPRAFREYGSGRPVPLAKPWLPGSR